MRCVASRGTLVCVALAVLSAVFSSLASAAEPQEDSCSRCHLAMGTGRLGAPAKDFHDDIHRARGFGCVSCHGGDGNDPGMSAMDPAKGYIGRPARERIPQVCGRCHSDARFMKSYNPTLRVDQVTEYETSVHGQRLREFSDPKVATCVSCHTAHSIRPKADPRSTVYVLRVGETCASCHADVDYMRSYKIPTAQLTKYEKSVHWKALSVKGDLSAPTCNTCHGSHGAAPPGISWVGNVCGTCHAQNQDLFEKSSHAAAFVRIGRPGCATCHENHQVTEAGDAMLGLGEGALCSGCHSAEDRGGKTAVAMRRLIDELRNAHDRAGVILLEAEHAGMQVSHAQVDLKGALTDLIKARTAVHSFSIGAVQKETEPGLKISAKAYAQGERALEEMEFRRKGLAVSVLIILSVIVGVVLKIRRLEQP
jgi:predicted CXXCH cytochrome family protein